MPPDPPSGKDSEECDLEYSLPIRGNNDRYIQDLLDHAQINIDLGSRPYSLYPPTSDFVPFSTPGLGGSTEAGIGTSSRNPSTLPVYTEPDGLEHVSVPTRNPYSLTTYQTTSSNVSRNERFSLPLPAHNSRPMRVIGDASHHFRPFVTRDPYRLPPFQQSSSMLSPQHSPSLFNRQLERSHETRYVAPAQLNPLFLAPPSPSTFSQPLEHWPSQSAQTGSDQLAKLPSDTRFGSVLHQRPADSQHRSKSFMSPSSFGTTTTPPINSSTTGSSPIPNLSSPLNHTNRANQIPSVSRNDPAAGHTFQLRLDHVPDRAPIVNNTRLVGPRDALPDQFRTIFPYNYLNPVQSKCFHVVYGTDDNVVISAPTGSGKTAVLEMAICKLAAKQVPGNFKIVYQAPTKSLCSERAKDWSQKFSRLNLECLELTGDTSAAANGRVKNASIIVTTPEKWDSITRKWKDHRRLLDLVRLVLIDEVHILKEIRGATLEAVVTRMKTIRPDIRFIAISATVPNINDVAQWIGLNYKTPQMPAHFEVFGEELRPIKVQRYVYGYEGSHNDFLFEQTLDGKLMNLMAKHSGGKPVMVFCPTRKSCERTAKVLAETWTTTPAGQRAWAAPSSRIVVASPTLEDVVGRGVAFHHAGLDAQDRSAVESNYLEGQLQVICCTSTLAVGVNLPCHTVVLKGTCTYTDNGLQELSDLEVMQMLGRAGRPQFDKSAVAIIMTRQSKVRRYESLVSGQELLESTLHQSLLEHINSEIELGTIQDLESAKKWIKGTFLSVRMHQNPSLYQPDGISTTASVDEQMSEWCERDVKLLQEHGLVTTHTPFVCTAYGVAMSRHLVAFGTMKMVLKIPRAVEVEELLKVICQTPAFRDVKFRAHERVIYRDLNRSAQILYPIRETVAFGWHKVFLIAQIYLGHVDMPTDRAFRLGMLRESRMVLDRLVGLLRCVVDCKESDRDGFGLSRALELARSVSARAWEDKPIQLSQIPTFGPVTVRKWIDQGVHTVHEIAGMSSFDIDRRSSRNPPYGQNLLQALADFPRLTLKADIIESMAPTSASDKPITITLNVRLGHSNPREAPKWNTRHPSLTFIAWTDDGRLAYCWHGDIRQIRHPSSTGLNLKFPVALTAYRQTIICIFSCDVIVGTQVQEVLRPNVPAFVFESIHNHDVEHRASQVLSKVHEEAFENDITDEAMLEAEAFSKERQLRDNPGVSPHHPDEDFPLIDDVIAPPAIEAHQPEKMTNGKWMCNHICRNGGRTKAGKPCSHQCCLEGVDNPRPSRTRAILRTRSERGGLKSKGNAPDCRTEDSVPKTSIPTQGPVNDDTQQANGRASLAQTLSGLKRPRSPEEDEIRRQNSPKRQNLDTIEHVDLSRVYDNEAAVPRPILPPLRVPRKQKPKLVYLEETRRGDDHESENPRSRHGSNTDYPQTTPVKSRLERSMEYHKTTPEKAVEDYTSFDHLGEAFSDWSGSDTSDPPDIDEIIDRSRNSNEAAVSENAESHDETLHPGAIQTLEQSLEQGTEPNLSFTTVDELHKASQRLHLNLRPTAVPERRETQCNDETALASDHQTGDGERGLAHDAVDESPESPWAGLDTDFLASLRSVANFVDDE